MKKTFTLFLALLTYLSIFAQGNLSKISCNSETYKELAQNRSNFKTVNFEQYQIEAYGKTPSQAIYHGKILALRELLYQDYQSSNPLLDSVLSQLSGDLIKLSKDDFKLKRKKGQYVCKIYSAKYNEKLANLLKDKINQFIRYRAILTFGIDTSTLDNTSKELYSEVLKQLHTLFASADLHFTILEQRMLNLTYPAPRPKNYNPCQDGYRYYSTGNKFFDKIEAIRHSNYNVDFVFMINSINTYENNGKCYVKFNISGFNVKTAVELVNYNVETSINQSLAPYYCVKQALTQGILKDKINDIMYQIVRRFADYVRNGSPMTIRICQQVFGNEDVKDNFELALSQCKSFILDNQDDWVVNGQPVGQTYVGRTLINEPVQQKLLIKQLLKQAGAKDFKVNILGNIYYITKN